MNTNKRIYINVRVPQNRLVLAVLVIAGLGLGVAGSGELSLTHNVSERLYWNL